MSIIRNRELSQFGSFLYIDNTTRDIGIATDSIPYVGIGTADPLTKFQVERYAISTGIGTFSSTAGISTDIDSFTISSSDFKTAEYTLHFMNGVNIQTQKVLVMQNGTNAYSQEYAIMYEPNQIISIGATVSSGVCKLQATPETGITGITTYRFTREAMI